MAGLLACGWPLRPAFPARCFRSGPVAYGASLAAYSCGGSHDIGAVCKTSNRALPCSLLTHRLHEAGGTIDGQCGAETGPRQAGRSEEHTSELQSLMRISYAVFCLTKKTSQAKNQTNKHTT